MKEQKTGVIPWGTLLDVNLKDRLREASFRTGQSQRFLVELALVRLLDAVDSKEMKLVK